jgi:alpha-N-arabinofuranosidase
LFAGNSIGNLADGKQRHCSAQQCNITPTLWIGCLDRERHLELRFDSISVPLGALKRPEVTRLKPCCFVHLPFLLFSRNKRRAVLTKPASRHGQKITVRIRTEETGDATICQPRTVKQTLTHYPLAKTRNIVIARSKKTLALGRASDVSSVNAFLDDGSRSAKVAGGVSKQLPRVTKRASLVITQLEGDPNMFSASRRRFLQQATTAGFACSAGLAFKPSLFAQTAPGAAGKIYVDSRRTLGIIDPNLFGSFLEHLGRAIYEGIYEPGSKLADPNGFRKDVLAQIRELGVPIVRYPGGNFVSGYNWLDGVGPVENRPRVLDKAWDTLDSNRFGTNEFMAWCKAAGTQPLMGLNLGTGTTEEAAALVEYCNIEKGTRWSDLRRQHGVAEPHQVKHWCLGNEMDGPWQIGHMPAVEYGMKAADAARQMRYVDRSIKLIACGSSGAFMPTYLEWDREVLERCYEYVDGLSLHRYFGNNTRDSGGDSAKFVALNLMMERQIAETLAVCDYVRGRQRSPKKLWLSFDEWNVWYRTNTGDAVDGHGREAPHLLEEVYNLEDALLVGGMVNTLLRNADRVKIACLAQLINVIAPIMVNENGLYRQTIYYPYSWGLQFAKGSALNLLVESSTYDAPDLDHVPHLDVAGSYDGNGKLSLFILNRDLTKAHDVEVVWQDAPPTRVLSASVITGDDLKAANSFASPQHVAPQALSSPKTSAGKSRFEVPARSYTVVQWAV